MDSFMRKCVVDRQIVQQLLLGNSFNQITKTLKVGKRRVRKIFDNAKKIGYLDGKAMPKYPQPLFQYKDVKTGNKPLYGALLLEHRLDTRAIGERLEAYNNI